MNTHPLAVRNGKNQGKWQNSCSCLFSSFELLSPPLGELLSSSFLPLYSTPHCDVLCFGGINPRYIDCDRLVHLPQQLNGRSYAKIIPR